MSSRRFLSLLIGISLLILSMSPRAEESCVSCHAEQYSRWQHSHHAKAMLPAEPDNVLANFDDGVTRFNGVDFAFVHRDEKFWVRISEPGKEPKTLPIDFTFGVYPLQQYLARLPGGRYQAIPVAWDSRDQSEGGQRWYALESDLAWDHPGFNWNTSCAECHSTDLRKNYDPERDAFDTRWDEINVSCASCHGEGTGHRAWLQAGQAKGQNAGFSASLKERGQWHWHEGSAIARRAAPPSGEQLSTCGQCHSRRTKIGDWHPGAALLDHIQPSLVTPPLYYEDGQIHDEVFVLASFMQSKMHQAGVVCSNCHEPHSLELRAKGDSLCAQCHRADVFESSTHHKHSPADVQCVDCHMPATVYMGVDARRDHRFGIPDPGLSKALGSPDVCTNCHGDKTAENLSTYLPFNEAPDSLQQTRRFAGQGNVLYSLEAGEFPPIREASMLPGALNPADAAAMALVAERLSHPDPLVRMGAVRAVSHLDPGQRLRLLQGRLTVSPKEPAKAVRLELAAALAGTLGPTVSDEQRRVAVNMFKEYEATLRQQLDSPAANTNLGNFYAAQGRLHEARDRYRHAIKLDSGFAYPYLQLAALAERVEREQLWLSKAETAAPADAEVQYQWGLFQVRAQDYQAAIGRLLRAVELAPGNENYVVTYAVALENRGELAQAIQYLTAFFDSSPESTRAADLLVRYALKSGNRSLAEDVVKRWLSHSPAQPDARRWQAYLKSH